MNLKSLFCTLTLVSAVTTTALAQSRPTVAVLEFEYGAVSQPVMRRPTPMPMSPFAPVAMRSRQTSTAPIDPTGIGRGIADLFVDALMESGEVRLIERTRLADIARERTGGDTVPARYLVMGSITRFGGEEKTRAGSMIAMGIASAALRMPLLGSFSSKDSYAYVEVTSRVVDATTGEIIGTASGHGQSKRRGLLLGGLGVRNGLYGGHLDVSSSGFQATILGEATTAAVKEAAAKLKSILTRDRADDGTQ